MVEGVWESKSFILRVWRADQTMPWRVSIEPISAESTTLHFADLDSMVQHLNQLRTISEPLSAENGMQD